MQDPLSGLLNYISTISNKENLMKTLWYFSAAALLIGGLVGCQQKRTDIVTEMYLDEQKNLESIVLDIFVTAKKKDLDRLDGFHLNSPKFTKFEESDIFTRRNYPEARKAENDIFSAISEFKYEVQDFKADVFGDAAVTTFYFQYKAKLGDASLAGRLRGTLVFVKVDNTWKIVHEHFSEFPPNPA
jgi:hypothetical protein